jgi:predicted protein tyrosine phosphatase
MRLVVCPLEAAPEQAARRRPAGVISLLSPEQAAPIMPGDSTRLCLGFHDISEPRPGLVLASGAHVDQLLAFAAAFAPAATLLIHCWMGISRSPAAAFILACARDPDRPEAEIAAALRRAAPFATPNAHLVRLADARLGRCGRMSAAISAIGRGCEASVGRPFELDA